MRFLAFLFLSVAIVRSAAAAIGDDYDRVDSAYGDVVKRHLNDDGSVMMTYKKNPYLFHVLFRNLQSVSEEYLRTGRERPFQQGNRSSLESQWSSLAA